MHRNGLDVDMERNESKGRKNGAEEGFCAFSPWNASHTHAHTETHTHARMERHIHRDMNE